MGNRRERESRAWLSLVADNGYFPREYLLCQRVIRMLDLQHEPFDQGAADSDHVH